MLEKEDSDKEIFFVMLLVRIVANSILGGIEVFSSKICLTFKFKAQVVYLGRIVQMNNFVGLLVAV